MWTSLALGPVLTLGSLTVLATAGAPDYAGIALLITAISGLLGTLAAIVQLLRRKPSVSDEVLLKLLERKDPDA